MGFYSRNFGAGLPRVVAQDNFTAPPVEAPARSFSIRDLVPLVGASPPVAKTVYVPTAADIAADVDRKVAAALEADRLKREAAAKAQSYLDDDTPWMDQEMFNGVANKWLLVGGGVLVLALGGFAVTRKKSSVAGLGRRRSRR